MSLHAILIAVGTILALALAMAKAASLADQQRDRLLRDLHQRHNSEVGSARASGTGREAGPTAAAPVSGATDPVLAVAPDQSPRVEVLTQTVDRLRAELDRTREQQQAAETRYTRLAGAMVNLLDACEGFGSWGVVEAAVIAARKALGEAE